MGRDGQVSALALFSEELRRARVAAGLTQDQLAERGGYSPSLVAHVETGSRAPSLDFARPVSTVRQMSRISTMLCLVRSLSVLKT